MAAKARDNFSDRVLTVVHTSGGTTRLLAVQAEAGGIRLLEAKSLSGSPNAAIEAIWQSHGRGRILRIVPGAGSVCRVGNAATGSDAETMAALSLVGEALLPTDVPSHRRAAGVLASLSPVAEGDSRVLATAWIGTPPAPLTTKPSARTHATPEQWVTHVGALSACIGGPGMAAYVDADARTIAILASGPERAVARQLLGDSSTSESWRDSVASTVDESAEISGLAGTPDADIARTFTGSTGLLINSRARTHLRGAISGIPTDDRWLDQFGLCVAAAAVAFGPATLRPLAQLTAEPPKVEEPALIRGATWVSSSTRPKAIIIAAACVLLLGPIAFATVRHGVLKSKASHIDEQKTSREQIDRQAALYSQLETSRWPVTKLLSDLSVAMPIGISATTINLSTEMGLKITGVAKEQALVNTLQANLNATKLFRNVKVTRTGTVESGEVEFDMSAEVASPHNAVASPEDFTAKTLAVRLYGEGADNTKEAPVSSKSGSRRTSRTEESGASTSSGGSSRRAADAAGPPPALSDADIAKMDLNTARKEWAARKTYVQKNPTLDTANKDRLNAEVPKLLEQMNKARSSGGGT